MNSITKKELKSIIKDILFENHIKEMFIPDNFVNHKSDMYNRPIKDKEEDINIPITADDFVSVSLLKRNHDSRDKDYSPKSVELKSALYSVLDDYKSDQLTDDVAEKIWKSTIKILDKVQ